MTREMKFAMIASIYYYQGTSIFEGACMIINQAAEYEKRKETVDLTKQDDDD